MDGPAAVAGRYRDGVLHVLDADSVRRWVVVTRAALAARRAEIDGLNVFPVPDGDTGTNMYFTLDQALDSVRAEHESTGAPVTLDVEAAAMSRAALMAARGNSGVILSQLIRGVSEVVTQEGLTEVGPGAVARAMAKGASRARESVVRPQEGTILSVAEATATEAARLAGAGADLAELSRGCVEAARSALARTPEQLEVLARAGVVDAGGAGFLLFVEALDQVVHEIGRQTRFAVDEFILNPSLERRPEWSERRDAGEVEVEEHDGPAYEVMYLLDDLDEPRLGRLRADLDTIGDSVVVSSAVDVSHVHVHTDDIGAALEAGLAHALPRRVAVTLLETMAPAPRVGLSVVACAAGTGIAAVLEEAGAATVASGPGHRASAGELVSAIRAAGTQEVILLPNDRDTRMAADAAARAVAGEGLTVHVVASGTAIQGLAALAVFDPGLTATQNVVAMTHAAAATQHGAVTVAVKEGLTSGGPCRIGDVLGVVSGDITIVGSDFDEVAWQVLDAITGLGAELVTLVHGQDLPAGALERLTDRLGHRPGMEVEVIDGGQPHYPLLLGAE